MMADLGNRFRVMFAENAERSGLNGTPIPLKGDVRIHFQGNPQVREWEEAPSDVLRVLGEFVRASVGADFDLGGSRMTHADITAVVSKAPKGTPDDVTQSLFIDVDLKDFKDVWQGASGNNADVIQSADDLVGNSRFQLQCLLGGIDKVETRGVVADLTKFKNLAIRKPKGPAQQRLEF